MSVYYCICTPSGFWTAVINVIIKKINEMIINFNPINY